MKKQILFVCYGLGIGGIEKCLVNLLNSIPEKYDIDVLLMNPQYTFKNQITRNVTFLDTFDYVMNIEDTLNEIKRRGGVVRNLGMFFLYWTFRLKIKMHLDAWKGFESIQGEYDVAIAYSHHDFSPYYVIDKVRANKKILWYHNGIYELDGKRYERDKRYFTAFDYVVAVSTDCAKMLENKFDFRDGQLIVLRNICNVDEIRSKATVFTPISFQSEAFHIVTVGRMTEEKGAMLALNACHKLREMGYNICWHWVGDGNQSFCIHDKVCSMKLQDYFIMEGNQDNPYPYIRCADVYVQSSYYEAYSTTITEAKVLCRPIVTTDVGGMRDQLTQGYNGLIIPIDVDAIVEAVKMLLDNEDIRNNFIAALKNEEFSSEMFIQKYEQTILS